MYFLRQLAKDLIRFSSKVLIVGVGVIVVTLIAGVIFSEQLDDPAYEETISVQGTAKRKVSPDSVTITFGRTLRDENIAKLQTDATEAINDLTDKLQDLGVEESQIRTNNYTVAPVYDTNGDIKSYSINASIVVTVEGINPREELVSDMIGLTTSTKINEIRNLQFYLKDQETAKRELEDEAIADAKEQAKKLAKSSGIKLGDVKNVSTGGYYPYYSRNYSYYDESSTVAEAAPLADVDKGADSIEIFQGEFDLETTVTLVYEVK